MSRFLSVPKTMVWGTLMLFMTVAFLPAQETPAPREEQPAKESPATEEEVPFSFGLNAALGAETLDKVNYQYLSLLPDFGYGKWGVGIDFSFHFEFYRDNTFGFYPRAKDWWDSDLSLGKNVDKYLARFAYIRYGKKGEPVYAQLGWIPSTTLGTGFIVSGYNNGALRPNTKLTGLNFDVTGALIDIPWIGFESFVGNVSTFDLVGARFYAKPLGMIAPEDPILKNTQFGLTMVADTNPYANNAAGGSGSVVVTGVDALAPLYNSDFFTTQATLDLTAEGATTGAALGFGGTAVKFLNWGVQFRALGDNFIPNYFDQGYELSRVTKYLTVTGKRDKIPGTVGYQTSLGTSLLGDAFQLGVIFSGPFGSVSNVLAQPQLVGYANLKPGLLPIDFNAFYLKRGVTSINKLVSAEDALIGAKVGYTYGVVTISVVYDLRYVDVPTNGTNWVTSSRIETAVKMF